MSSDAKIAANRANALKSTGPRTERGKTKSKLNAVTHGIYATTSILDGENEDTYRALENSYRKSFAPEGPLEDFLVSQITTLQWKIGRIDRADGALYDQLLDTQVERLTRSLDLKGLEYALSRVDPDFEISKYQVPPDAAAYDTVVRQSQYSKAVANVDPLTEADKNFIQDKILRAADPGSAILEMLVSNRETAPQECLDRHRRTLMRDYLALVAQLKEIQEARRIVTVTPKLVAEQKAGSIIKTKRSKPLPSDRPAKQNHPGPNLNGSDVSANARTLAARSEGIRVIHKQSSKSESDGRI